jgi:SAM-dependent methyltransferase
MNETLPSPVGASRSKWDLVTRVLGTIDLHYHFRTRPLRRFFAKHERNRSVRIFEFGCGNGGNLLELRARRSSMIGVGMDIDHDFIHAAQISAKAKGFDGLSFVCTDSIDEIKDKPASFDYVMLIDVLEHLDDPSASLHEAARMLKPGGSVLISVPTRRYPRIFGREYHEAVGHVRDGFNLQELDDLFGPSFERVQYNYNTGLIASAACACFYRFVPNIRSRKLAIFSMISLHLSRLVDVLNGESRSCSLWAVYRQVPMGASSA